MRTAKLSERLAVVATIDPASRNSGTTTNSDVIDMAYIPRVLIVTCVGAITSGGSLDVTAYANTANSTSGGTAITGKTLAAGTHSDTGDNNTQSLIEVTAEDVRDAVSGGRYLYVAGVTADAAVIYGVTILGEVTRFRPASDYDLASVAEIV